MDLTIEQSVGVNGRNLVQDVALVQLMLKLLHRGSGGSGPYYRGEINGLMQGPTTGALLGFFKDVLAGFSEAKRKGIKTSPPLLVPGGVMMQELSSYFERLPFFKLLDPIAGTPFFYWLTPDAKKEREMNKGKTPAPEMRQSKEFLIPEFMQPKRLIKIGDADPFHTRFKEVRLMNTDHLEIDFSLHQVAYFMNPRTLKKETRPTSRKLLAHLALAVRGGNWKLKSTMPSGKGHFTLVSAQPSGLRNAVQFWRRQDIYARVFDKGEKHLLIPAFDEALYIVARAQVAVCFTRFKKGELEKPPGYDKLEKHVLAIKENSLGISPEIWDAHCKGCEELLAEAMAYDAQVGDLEAKRARLDPKLAEMRRHSAVIQSYQELDLERKKKLADAAFTAWSIPLEGDVLYTRDIDDIVVGDDDLVELVGVTARELGPQKPMLLKLARSTIFISEVMALADVVEAIFRTIQVIDLNDEYQEAVSWMKAEWPYLRQQLVDLMCETDGIRLQLASLLWRRKEMGCGTG